VHVVAPSVADRLRKCANSGLINPTNSVYLAHQIS
jgi:hypothetical protein